VKVLMLETSGWGGVSHYSHCLSDALAALGMKLTLVTNEVHELRNIEKRYDVLPVLKDGGSYMERVRRFLRTLRSESPDVLHIQSGFSARRDWLMMPRFRKHCQTMVMTSHNVLPHETKERNAVGMEFTLGRIYRSCDGIIAHSCASRDMLVDTFCVDAERVAVIPHGNYLVFPDMSQEDVEGDVTRDEILFFGHLREYKGVDVLIRAFARVRAERERACLVIAGKEQEGIRGTYEKIIAEEGLEDSVFIQPGYVSAGSIARVFATARLVVFPYRETDGSGAIQLAYAFGKPVVATSVGAFPEIVEEEVNGYLIPPEDPDALAGAILRFLSLPLPEADKMGRMSRLLTEKVFSWERIAERTVEFYRSIS
jgi:D-inositol-3-phosphate glycosyltransferase